MKTYYILPLVFIFLHSLPRAAHPFLPLSLSHSFDQVAQVEALSKFTLPSKLFFEYIDSKLTSFEFKFHAFFVSICINSGDLKTSKWNHGSPSMKLHEILG
jgi:hypothetical protein